MAASPQTQAPPKAGGTDLQEIARRHLWMHFTRMGSYGPDGGRIPIIERGEGCYVWDTEGNRYLDGLSALFCVNAGHGREELGEAMAAQVKELDFVTIWSYAHPARDRARRAHRRPRPRRPQPGLLHQQRLGGGRVGLQARPQLPPHAGQRPEDQADRPRDRLPRHHARARSPPPASRRCARSSSRWSPAAATSPTPTATAGPRTATRSGPPTGSRSGSCSRGPRPWPP